MIERKSGFFRFIADICLIVSLSSQAQTQTPSAGGAGEMTATGRVTQASANTRRFEPLVGTWEVVQTIRLSADAQPIVTRGIVARRSWIGDNAVLQERMEPATGVRMPPFTRLAYFSYNNAAQKFEYVLIMDTRAPGIGVMFETSQGDGGENGGNTITFYLEGFSLPPGWSREASGQWVKQRRVVRVESSDRHVSQQYWTLPAGREWLAVEYVYTRQR